MSHKAMTWPAVLAGLALFLASPAFAQGLGSSGTTNLVDLARNLVTNIDGPFLALLSILCYISGLWLVIQGLLRMPAHSSLIRGNSSLSRKGTLAWIVIGVILIFLPQITGLSTETLFEGETHSYATFGGTPVTGSSTAQTLLDVCLRLLQLFGYWWFLSAWFTLLDAADNRGGKSFRGGLAKMLCALLLINIYSTLSAVQNTLGLRVLEIT